MIPQVFNPNPVWEVDHECHLSEDLEYLQFYVRTKYFYERGMLAYHIKDGKVTHVEVYGIKYAEDMIYPDPNLVPVEEVLKCYNAIIAQLKDKK